MLPYFTGLDQVWTQCLTLDVVLYQLLRASEQQCHESVCNPVVLPPNSLLIVLFCLFLPICIVQTVCVCSLCTYHVFLKENVRYPVWTCRDLISPILGDLIFIQGTRIGSLKRLNKSLDLAFVTKP